MIHASKSVTLEEYLRIDGELGVMMKDFTVKVLQELPHDVYQFAAEYFSVKWKERQSQKVPLFVVVNDDKASEPENLRLVRRSLEPQSAKSGSAFGATPLGPAPRGNGLDSISEAVGLGGRNVDRRVSSLGNSFAAEQKKRGKNKISPVRQAAIKEADSGQNQPSTTRRAGVTSEVFDPETSNTSELKVYNKSPEQRASLKTIIDQLLIFESLEDEVKKVVIDVVFEREVSEGEIIIKQGDVGEHFYIIQNGDFQITIQKEDAGESKIVQTLNGKGCFGEFSLMYNIPRQATVKALTKGNLWVMDRVSFKQIVLSSAYNKRQTFDRLIQTCPILKSLTEYERMNLADALVSKTYRDGDSIILMGQTGDGMYFIQNGQCRVTVQDDKNKKKVVEVAILNEGHYFGEVALLESRPRTANVYAKGDVKVAFLERGSFERMLGPCVDIMKRHVKAYKRL